MLSKNNVDRLPAPVVTLSLLFFSLTTVAFLLFAPAGACTFAGTGMPAPCTFTMDAVDSSCMKSVTTVTVTSLIDNNKINESAAYVNLVGASGTVRLIAGEDKSINTGQSLKLYAVRDGPLPSGASATVVASGISDTKPVSPQGCNCSIVLANTSASFDPDSGTVLANGTIRGSCILSGMVFALLNKTTGLASERRQGFPTGGAFSFSSSNQYTSDEASQGLEVLLLAWGYNGAFGAYFPPIGSFRDFKLSLPKSSLAIEPGKPVDVAILVTNFNNEPDTYSATAQVPHDWSSETAVFSVGPGSSSNRLLRIIPSTLTFSEAQNVAISVVSSSTGKAKAASILLSPSSLKPAIQSYVYQPKVVLMGRSFDAKAVINATAPGTVRHFFYTEPFVKIDVSEGKASIPAGLSSLPVSSAVRDICTLPDSVKFLRKMNVYWSVMKDILPNKDPILVKKVMGKIESYKGSTATPSLSAARSNISAIASSLESRAENIDARISAMLLDMDVLKDELNAEENRTMSAPRSCKPVANADLVLDFISYADASESIARNGINFASGDVLGARLLDESGNYVASLNMRPGEVKNLKVEITNGDTETRQFAVDVMEGVLANFISLEKSQVTIGGGQMETVGLTIQMPTVISGTKNATIVVSSSPHIKSLPIVVTMGGPEVSGTGSYTLEPGSSTTLSFSIRNNDKTDDTYSLSITGAPEGAKWFTVPQTFKVAGGKEGKLQIKMNTPTVATGTYNFTLTAYSQTGGVETRFDFAVIFSGEFRALRAQASEVDAIHAEIKEKCPSTVVNAAILKDARSMITAGRLPEAKTKMAFAKSEAERALTDCTGFKIPFGLILLVLGGLALAYFWFFVVRKPSPPERPPQGGKRPPPPAASGGIELPTATGGEGKSSEQEEETWI